MGTALLKQRAAFVQYGTVGSAYLSCADKGGIRQVLLKMFNAFDASVCGAVSRSSTTPHLETEDFANPFCNVFQGLFFVLSQCDAMYMSCLDHW